LTSYIGGDQFNQYGYHNIGKIDQRSESTVNNLSVTGRGQAIAELASFIDYLEKTGLISTSGQLTDVKAIEVEIVSHESRLRKVAHGLIGAGSGHAKRDLDGALKEDDDASTKDLVLHRRNCEYRRVPVRCQNLVRSR
jgi:hypothetical protein